MLEGIPDDNQEILNQLHSDVFLQRMKDHLDGGTNLNENDASDLNETVRRLLMEDASPSIDTEDIQRLLKDDDISQAIASLIKSQNKET